MVGVATSGHPDATDSRLPHSFAAEDPHLVEFDQLPACELAGVAIVFLDNDVTSMVPVDGRSLAT